MRGSQNESVNVYKNDGSLVIDSAVNEKGNHGVTYDIDLEKWYHIEIVQETENGQVRC